MARCPITGLGSDEKVVIQQLQTKVLIIKTGGQPDKS